MNIHRCYILRHLILAAVLTIGFASSGVASSTLAQQRVFFIDLNSKEVTDLGTLGGGARSVALGINDAGQVVGQNGNGYAFITGPDGVGMTVLGTLGGRYGVAAYGINDMGQVVGESLTTANGPTHAFITGPNGVGMTDLGSLGGGGYYSRAYGINNAGQVVGESQTESQTIEGTPRAFITGPNGVGMTDLNYLVNPPTGLVFFGATAINNYGQLAAVGAAVVPEPETHAMLLSGLGLISFLARGRAPHRNVPSQA